MGALRQRWKPQFMGGRLLGWALSKLGWALSELGQHRTAVRILEHALCLAGEQGLCSDIHTYLGYACYRLKNRDQALRHYRAAVEADAANAYAQGALGACYAEGGKHRAALPHLEAATRLEPGDASHWYAFGRILARKGELDRAQEALERALALRFPDGRARAQLAAVYQRQGKADDAVEQAKQALKRPLPEEWRTWVDGIICECQRGRR